MQTDAALGEIFLKAFVPRRVFLISNSVGDAVLIGSNHSSDTRCVSENFFLATVNLTAILMSRSILTCRLFLTNSKFR
jgi:hypothetical protein